MTFSIHEKPLVRILLSTFNGSEFLETLLLSLKGQIGVNIQLIFRDDGSVDNSVTLVKSFFPDAIECIHQPLHIGSTASYMHLLSHLPPNSYAAFCDQDDIWMPDKTVECLTLLEENSADLVATSVQIMGSDTVFPKFPVQASLFNLLFENNFRGCTMTFKSDIFLGLDKIIQGNYLKHDELLALTGLMKGNVIFLSKPTLLYRLHRNNETGIPTLSENSYILAFKRLFRIIQLRKIVRRKLELIRLLQIESDSKKFQIPLLEVFGYNFCRRLKHKGKGLQFRLDNSENVAFRFLWLIGLFKFY